MSIMQETIIATLQGWKKTVTSGFFTPANQEPGLGFSSPDSDYDVRFIYAHPTDWYFSIDERKDTIELPVNEVLDIGGWDIRKALQQFRKATPPFSNGCNRSIYRENPAFSAALRRLMPDYFAPRALVFSSSGISPENTGRNGERERNPVEKDLLYPPFAALGRVGKEKGTVPPMTFEPLRELIGKKSIVGQVAQWLELKQQSDEKTRVKKWAFFEEYVLMEMARCESYAESAPINRPDSVKLSELFRQTVNPLA